MALSPFGPLNISYFLYLSTSGNEVKKILPDLVRDREGSVQKVTGIKISPFKSFHRVPVGIC